MNNGAIIGLAALAFSVLAVFAIWRRARTNPDVCSEADLFTELEKASEEYWIGVEAERQAVLRDRQVKEEILAELKAARAKREQT